jgi:hypothetical protein
MNMETSSTPLLSDTLLSAFPTLSSIATNALYALEREEAHRRAEYEAKHSKTLRRIEHAVHHTEILQSFGRLSKSAAASPVATPYLSGGSAAQEYLHALPQTKSVHGPTFQMELKRLDRQVDG